MSHKDDLFIDDLVAPRSPPALAGRYRLARWLSKRCTPWVVWLFNLAKGILSCGKLSSTSSCGGEAVLKILRGSMIDIDSSWMALASSYMVLEILKRTFFLVESSVVCPILFRLRLVDFVFLFLCLSSSDIRPYTLNTFSSSSGSDSSNLSYSSRKTVLADSLISFSDY